MNSEFHACLSVGLTFAPFQSREGGFVHRSSFSWAPVNNFHFPNRMAALTWTPKHLLSSGPLMGSLRQWEYWWRLFPSSLHRDSLGDSRAFKPFGKRTPILRYHFSSRLLDQCDSLSKLFDSMNSDQKSILTENHGPFQTNRLLIWNPQTLKLSYIQRTHVM